jgi:Rrf2 family transcriptional regulator, nitric oxide-sensitive transcriptional repressor
MELTTFSDYSLRVLIFTTLHRERLVTVGEISEAYDGISRNHLVKVVNNLASLGLVETVRGRGGGVRLKLPPEQINVGELIRQTEPHVDLLPCMKASDTSCVIDGSCLLKHALYDAREAFFDVLRRYTIADVTQNRGVLLNLFD